jgi:hypothetical protein
MLNIKENHKMFCFEKMKKHKVVYSYVAYLIMLSVGKNL